MLWIKRELCTGCGRCIEVCDIEGAILLVEGKAIIDPSKCISCDRCVEVCTVGAIQSSVSPAEPEEIQYIEVHPEGVVQQQDTLPKPASEPIVPAPKTHRWPAIAGGIASTALGVAATLGETLLNRWLEGGDETSGSTGSGRNTSLGRKSGRRRGGRGGRGRS